MYWSLDRLDDAKTALYSVKYDGSPVAQTRAKILHSWILASKDDYIGQAALLVEALQVLKGAPISDVGLMANALHEAYTEACIARAQNKTNELRRLAKMAYSEFEAMGFEWRAARAALLLYESGLGAEWLERAKTAARNYPRSFVADKIARAFQSNKDEYLGKITPRAREVFTLLCCGKSTDEIACSLGSSPGTVRVHIANIHRAFGVSTRSQLLVKAKQHGLL